MNKLFRLFAVIIIFLVTTSCIRDEIHEIQKNYHVQYNIDYGVLYNAPVSPEEMIWLRFYDVNTHKRIFETWANPNGTDLTITPGNYDIVAYTYRNNATKFSYESDLSLLTAYTQNVSLSNYSILASPSHFFYGILEDYNVPYVAANEPPHKIVIPMKSPLDSWRVIITGIEGLENCRSLIFYLTHQRTEILLGSMEGEGDAIMQFEGQIASNNSCIDTRFNTFGMVPNEKYELQVQIKDASGASYIRTVDVTEQINEPENKEHIITFRYEIKLLQMQEGGVLPSADPWKELEEHHIFK